MTITPSGIPNLFVVGAMKAGTTALYDLLDSHPEVGMSPIKEPNHFGSDLPIPANSMFSWDPGPYVRFRDKGGQPPHQAFVRDAAEYRALFGLCSAAWCGEASVSYLYSRTAVEEIVRECPAARFVVTLRDPVARAASHHGSELAIGRETEARLLPAIERDLEREQSWGKAFLYVALGLYEEQVRRLLDTAGQAAVRVVFFDDLVSDPRRVNVRLAEFLDIDPLGFTAPANRNVGVRPRFPRVNAVLHRTGLKSIARRATPAGFLRRAKGAFYRLGPAVASPSDIEELRQLFVESDRRLWRLLDSDPRW